jgi:hypothetical protein
VEEAEAFNPLNYPGKFTILLQEHNMDTKTYPEIGFLRLRDIIGDKSSPGIIPVRRSSQDKGISEGRYPKPVKLSERTSASRVEDIRKLIEDSNLPLKT